MTHKEEVRAIQWVVDPIFAKRYSEEMSRRAKMSRKMKKNVSRPKGK